MPYKDLEIRRTAGKRYAKQWRLRNPTASREATARYCLKNLEKIKAQNAKPTAKRKRKEYQALLRKKDPAGVRARLNAWRAANPEKWKAIQRRSYEKKLNAGVHAARTAKRRSTKTQATPAWANASVIQKIYRTARELNMQVDHIVPLHSPIVCGLHCESNLQLLDPLSNNIKSNTTWPDMP